MENTRFKFRAWNIIVKRFQYFGFKELAKMDYKDIQWHILEFQQCTGLKDKNGKLIYEGDILRYPPKNDDDKNNYVACEVFFHDNDCCQKHIGWQMNRFHFQGNLCGIINYGIVYDFIPKHTEKMEVIGNKFENPELLESEGEE